MEICTDATAPFSVSATPTPAAFQRRGLATDSRITPLFARVAGGQPSWGDCAER